MERRIRLKPEADCVGCGACIAVCAKNAVKLRNVGFGATLPYIDETRCVQCGKCEAVCYVGQHRSEEKKRAYIFVNRDRNLLLKSASGGAFSALANHILSEGGIVYGAELKRTDEGLEVVHSRIDKPEDLPRILGSKYVNGDCTAAYREVKADLRGGKRVLFSGRSCQVNALYNFLGTRDVPNLVTVDLICHGVPGERFFSDYIAFLRNRLKATITNFAFRVKQPGKISYTERIDYIPFGQKDIRQKFIPLQESAYYRLFLSEQSYRQACYSCPFATIDKPADITMGDYFEAMDDYPELFTGNGAIDRSSGISAILVHTAAGADAFRAIAAQHVVAEVDPKKVQASHKQLNRPGTYTQFRATCLRIYEKWGYGALHRYMAMKRFLRNLIEAATHSFRFIKFIRKK